MKIVLFSIWYGLQCFSHSFVQKYQISGDVSLRNAGQTKTAAVKPNVKSNYCTHVPNVDLWEFNKREIAHALPCVGPLEVPRPHFGNHCPKQLIKLLYFSPIWPPGSQKAPALQPCPGTPFSFYGAWLLTQSPLSDCASLFTHGPDRVSVRQADQSAQVEMTNSANFPLFLKVTELAISFK